MSESGVKKLKSIIRKTGYKRQSDIDKAVMEYNKLSRTSGGGSPAQIFFNRNMRPSIPSVATLPASIEQLKQRRERLAMLTRDRKGSSPKSAQFLVGDRVRCLDSDNRWTKTGTIVAVRRHGGSSAWSYRVLDDEGRTSLKSRTEIRIRRSSIQNTIGGLPIE